MSACFNHLSLTVTLGCNLRCPRCSQRKLIERYSNYQMGMGEIEAIIEHSGGHRFEILTFTGGEPLVWEHLEEGVKRIRHAEIADRLELLSNGILADRITPALLDKLDQVRLSFYGTEAGSFARLKRAYGEKVVIADRRVMTEVPSELLPPDEVLPAECSCLGWMVGMGYAYACVMVPTVLAECGLDYKAYPELICDLGPGYLERLEPYMRGACDLCRGCISNARVKTFMNGRRAQ